MTNLTNDPRPHVATWEKDNLDCPEESIPRSVPESEVLPLPAGHFHITNQQQWIDLCA